MREREFVAISNGRLAGALSDLEDFFPKCIRSFWMGVAMVGEPKFSAVIATDWWQHGNR